MSEPAEDRQGRYAVTVWLPPEDLAWLDSEAERVGLEREHVLKMMIRKARMCYVAEPDSGMREAISRVTAERMREAERIAYEKERKAKAEALDRQIAALAAEKSDLERLATINKMTDVEEEQEEFTFPLEEEPLVVPSGQTPASVTRPVGVSASVPRGYDRGDPMGSVARQNFAHLGFDGGGRARR